MLYESQYYGVVPLGNELYHHGIKGQKWGVRRFQNKDGSLTAAGEKRYYTDDGKLTKYGEKQYKKDVKKLKKLQDRADLDVQKRNAEKYSKRAKIARNVGLGAGAVAVGSHLLDAGLERARPGIVSSFKRKIAQNEGRTRVLKSTLDQKTGKMLRKHWAQLDIIEKQPDIVARQKAMDLATKRFDTQHRALWTEAHSGMDKLAKNSDFLRKTAKVLGGVQKGAHITKMASAGVAAGAGATYAYNKIKAHAAKKRMTDLGHEKAVADVKRQMDYMKQKYGDIKLDDLRKKG